MKTLLLIALMLIPFRASAQKVSKQRMSQPTAQSGNYSLKIHVTRSFLTQDGGVAYLHLAGVLGGQNIELGTTGGTLFNTPLLPPGDYAAQLTGENVNKNGSVLRQYDLLLANGQHQIFTLIGLSE